MKMGQIYGLSVVFLLFTCAGYELLLVDEAVPISDPKFLLCVWRQRWACCRLGLSYGKSDAPFLSFRLPFHEGNNYKFSKVRRKSATQKTIEKDPDIRGNNVSHPFLGSSSMVENSKRLSKIVNPSQFQAGDMGRVKIS